MKTALVTGASKGIGRQIAITLAEKGYTVIGTYNSTSDGLDIISKLHGIIYEKCDVSDYVQVVALFAHIKDSFKTLDCVVNCAGVSWVGLLQDMKEDEIAKLVNVNLNGTIYVCQQAADVMVKQHAGSIVNISSIWGNNGASCEAVYSATKGGINAFTKALAQELAPSGIRVNAVCPGVIKTDMLSCFSEEDLKNLAEETPLGRLGTVADVADTVEFLLSDKASFITGQIVTVDGGFSM
ncbi:MAG: SDR family oxidoreductase [Oscillospiraceae bacterium]|nr:SDR family oxidoreductase [Oscillospiraceae bacterium]